MFYLVVIRMALDSHLSIALRLHEELIYKQTHPFH